MGTLHVYLTILKRKATFFTSYLSTLDDETFKRGLLQKERICSCGSKVFPVGVDPNEKGSKNENDPFTHTKSVPILLFCKILN